VLISLAADELSEILDAWFATAPSDAPGDRANVEHVGAIKRR
jgi:ribose 5-phosphate isomerase B